MKTLFMLTLLCLLLTSSATCDEQKGNFCASAKASEDNLIVSINHYFKKSDKKETTETRLQAFKKHLLNQACVTEVLLGKGYLRTSPPKKEVIIDFNFDDHQIRKKLFLSVEDKKITAAINPN